MSRALPASLKQNQKFFFHLHNSATDKKHIKKVVHAANKHQSEDKQQKLYDSENDASAPWSNAFNFTKDWGVHVDPRTGVLSTYIKAGSLLSNKGHGPDITLNANYNSNTNINTDGLGEGWSWNLTHFDLKTDELFTSTGQIFYLQKTSNSQWLPMYHKLKDVLIQGDKSTHFIITYTNGLKEILNHDGYEVRIEQQNGWGVNFSYAAGSHLLTAITDDEKHQMTLVRKENQLIVASYNTTGQPAQIVMNLADNELQAVTLPISNNHKTPAINIKYKRHLITEEDYPTGLIQKLSYNCSHAMLLPAIGKNAEMGLCVVSSSKTIFGNGESPVITRYQYSTTNNNGHNYLAFNAGFSVMPSVRRDLLFEAPSAYTYKTQQDNGMVTDIHTYNKYHLLIDDKKISDLTGHILSEEQNFYCRIDQYDGCAHTSFDNLPVTYSLPLKIVTKIWGTSSNTPVISSIVKTYDKQGRIIRTVNDFGITSVVGYCSREGDSDCPEAPEKSLFSHLTKSVTIYPANNDTSLQPVVSRSYYRKLPNLKNNGYILVLDHTTSQSGDQWRTLKRYYYEDKANVITYGLLKKTVLTGTVPDNATLRAVTKNYYYALNHDGSKRITYSTINTGHGTVQRSAVNTYSTFTHQLLEKTDPSGTDTIRYHYDRFDRLIQTDSATGTDFAASIRYQYTVSPTLNQVMITAPSGLQQKIIFDSAGRQLINFSEAVDKRGKAQPGQWIPETSNFYDPYGHIIKQQHYILTDSGQQQMLTRQVKYDEMGRILRVDLPDKRVQFTQYDDHERCKISYTKDAQGKRSPVSIVRANKLDKPVKKFILPASQQTLPAADFLCQQGDTQPGARTVTMTYDNFGRIATVTGPSGKRVSRKYDELGRLTDIINPIGDKITTVYNLTGQIIQSWVSPKNGGHYRLSAAAYNTVGQLLWNSGEDGKRTFYTYTTNGDIATEVMPSGHVVSWKYNTVGQPTLKALDGKSLLAVQYNHLTRLPKYKTDITGVSTWHYSDDGLPLLLDHKGNNNYPDYQLQWQYDNNRRVISTTDISGNKTMVVYDALGRPKSLYYQKQNQSTFSLLYTPVYDSFSRIIGSTYGSGMQRTITYDALNHPAQVRDTLSHRLLSQWNYTFDSDDNITTIKQSVGSGEQGILKYQYDSLDNLVSMTCSGSDGLPLCPRDTDFSGSGLHNAPVIVQQKYTFTPLNQLASVTETLSALKQQQTLSKVMTYHYGDAAIPLRLHSIRTRWNKQAPGIVYLSYDAAGNMITDGQHNQISYNAFNQITHVMTASGTSSYYGYDGEDKEILEQNAKSTRYLFYRGDHLINESIHDVNQTMHITGYKGVAKTTDGTIDQFYEQNYRGDITGIFIKNSHEQEYKLTQRNIYSPYGMLWHPPSVSLSLYKQTLFGFEGERTDPITGWQFLGAGNRTYNPAQHYFVSEDPLTGGYGFGSNNPVMHRDPSGNMPQWVGMAGKIAGYVGTLGFSSISKKWAQITGTVISAALFVLSVGVLCAPAGGYVAAAAMTVSAIPASLPVAAAIAPSNKGLNITSAIVGAAEFTVTVAATMFTLGFCALYALSVDYSAVSSFGAASIPELVTEDIASVAAATDDKLPAGGASAKPFKCPALRPPEHYATEPEFTNMEREFVEDFINQHTKQLLFQPLNEQECSDPDNFLSVLATYNFSGAVTFDKDLYAYSLKDDLLRLKQRMDPFNTIPKKEWKAISKGFSKKSNEFYTKVSLFREKAGYHGTIFSPATYEYSGHFIDFFKRQIPKWQEQQYQQQQAVLGDLMQGGGGVIIALFIPPNMPAR
ncbi:MAG: hypothetical protein OXC48_00325 [Endozoicomonadaceae bacterium]|nr:hypothetical protein [Endozoicomonadaceae bacterium]